MLQFFQPWGKLEEFYSTSSTKPEQELQLYAFVPPMFPAPGKVVEFYATRICHPSNFVIIPGHQCPQAQKNSSILCHLWSSSPQARVFRANQPSPTQ